MSATADAKRNAYEFILANRAAALATVSKDNTPHVATVYCTVHNDLSVYFMTRVEARKFDNLRQQPKVAMAFSNNARLQTIQMTGVAERVEDFKLERSIWRDLMLLRAPQHNQEPGPAIQLFENGSTNEVAIIKVTPTEMTFANFETQQDGRYKTFFHKVM